VKRPLSDRIALVTGASRGIGRAIAVRLAEEGAFVFLNYTANEEAAGAALAAVRAAGGDGELSRFDIADYEAVQAAIDQIVKARGRLDLLVNNAGISIDGLLVRVRPEDFDRVIAVNLRGTFACLRAVAKPMMKQRYGRIVNLTSVTGEAGNPGQTSYSASKAGIIGMTKTLAAELASRGITVNAVSPGFIETDMTKALPEEAKTAFLSKIPVGRPGTPEEVADAVAFLCSERAGYITGQVLRVNGGMYL
jgi:3-oxoacyl-[acyl-carrier protein] reductase